MNQTSPDFHAAVPQPRQGGGVVGYVARLQQFDSAEIADDHGLDHGHPPEPGPGAAEDRFGLGAGAGPTLGSDPAFGGDVLYGIEPTRGVVQPFEADPVHGRVYPWPVDHAESGCPGDLEMAQPDAADHPIEAYAMLGAPGPDLVAGVPQVLFDDWSAVDPRGSAVDEAAAAAAWRVSDDSDVAPYPDGSDSLHPMDHPYAMDDVDEAETAEFAQPLRWAGSGGPGQSGQLPAAESQAQPSADTPSADERTRGGRRVAVLSATALVAALVAGGGYLALDPAPVVPTSSRAQAPAGPPGPVADPPLRGTPGGEAVAPSGAATDGTAEPSASAGEVAGAAPDRTAGSSPDAVPTAPTPSVEATPSSPVPPVEQVPAPPADQAPAPPAEDPQPAPPGATINPPRPAPVEALAATFTRTDNVLPRGFGGYVGTMRIVNRGSAAVTGWRILLEVPGARQIRPQGQVAVRQDGDQVAITPLRAAATVPAGGSVSFSFAVRGLRARDPSSCVIGERRCG